MSEQEPQVRTVTLPLCDLCLDGHGGECHMPGCALWFKSAPDIAIRDRVVDLSADDAVERIAEAIHEYDPIQCLPWDKVRDTDYGETRRGQARAALSAIRDGRAGRVSGTEIRAEFADILIDHTRTRIEDCHCGWGELGQSHSLHVADHLLPVVRREVEQARADALAWAAAECHREARWRLERRSGLRAGEPEYDMRTEGIETATKLERILMAGDAP